MDDKIFLQFYEILTGVRNPNNKVVACGNGFSNVWDIVKPIWVGPLIKGKTEMPALPKLAKKIYVSCNYSYHVYIVWRWAVANPDCEFYVGGSSVWPFYSFTIIKPLPQNFHIIQSTVEDMLGIPYNPDMWHLEYPKYEDPLYRIVYAYSHAMGYSCYWNKCKFCINMGHDPLKMLPYSIESINNGPPGIVWSVMPALTINQLRDFPKLNTKDKFYFAYIRGTKKELEILKEITGKIDPSRFELYIGVEFPSNKMLEYINKGIKLEEIQEIVQFAISNGYSVTLSLISGWPTLAQEDLEEAKKFYEVLPDGPGRIASKLFPLVIRSDANFDANNKGNQIIMYDTFSVGHYPRLTEKELKTNLDWIEFARSCKNSDIVSWK